MEQRLRVDRAPMPAVQHVARNTLDHRDLDAAAKRLLTQPSSPSRRSVIAGLLGAAAPAPAVALAEDGAAAHPDHVILDAEAELKRLTEIAEEAGRAAKLARDYMWEALGPCPSELIADADETRLFTTAQARRLVPHLRFQTVRPLDDSWCYPSAWTAPALHAAILAAVPVCGRAGTTPFRIRRYRALLPVAQDFDRRRHDCEERFWVKELSSASNDAREAQTIAERRLHALTATTMDGLAVIVRSIGWRNWEGLPSNLISLLLSAAKITGTDLGIPEFDPKRWVSELEAAGGYIVRPSRYSPAGVGFPVDHTHSPELGETLKRLSDERDAHKLQIRLFIERGEVVA